MRMSKLRLAEYHFRKASEIHPQNAVLLGCVGMVSGVTRARLCAITLLTTDIAMPGTRSGSRAVHEVRQGAGAIQPGHPILA